MDKISKDPGPWYVATLRNAKGETKTIVHTFAEHFAFAYAIKKPAEQWVMLELIGPFGSESEARKGESQNRWTFNEMITAPRYTVLTLANIKKLKGKEG